MSNSQHRREAEVKKLISSFAEHEPPLWNHGVPFLVDTLATQTLVQMGQEAVPGLIEGLDSENPKIAMYAAYCLGQIGDGSALPALRQARERYLAQEPKREYDFGVISAMDQAEEKLATESGMR